MFFLLYCCLWLTPVGFWLLLLILFCIVWNFSEIYQLISDLCTGDSPLQRTARDRELEGRLFDPEYRPALSRQSYAVRCSGQILPESR